MVYILMYSPQTSCWRWFKVWPINADCCQVENGCRTAHDVTGHPRITQSVSQAPHAATHLKRMHIYKNTVNGCQ